MIKDDKTATLIGVGVIKWLVYETFWRKTNPALTMAGYPSLEKLSKLKEEMTKAEVGHLIGFFVVIAIAIVFYVIGDTKQSIVLTAANVVFNLYPVFLQQSNKSRVESIMHQRNKPSNIGPTASTI